MARVSRRQDAQAAHHRAQLVRFLKIVSEAYDKSIDPGHSGLDREQPHRVNVLATLGDFRDLSTMIWRLEQ